MISIEKRALYHLLRMNWLQEPHLSIEPWQVEDYRSLPLTSLFERLRSFGLSLNRASFIAHADVCDSPEDLTEHLIGSDSLTTPLEDQVYLMIFELWRRLMAEKPSLSILCNELDYQIHLYDQELGRDPLALQEALEQFIKILDKNVDEGISPPEALKLISAYCANDIETFLYDFISDQIDEEHESYAHELLEAFDLYLGKNDWFKLLRLRLFGYAHSKMAQSLIDQLLEESSSDQEIDFDLEFLSVLGELEDPFHFSLLSEKLLSRVKQEEQLRDLLAISVDYFRHSKRDDQATQLEWILEKRSSFPLEQEISPNDPDLNTAAQILSPP